MLNIFIFKKNLKMKNKKSIKLYQLNFSPMIFNINLSRSISIRNLHKKNGIQTYMKHVDRFTRVIVFINSYFQFSRSLALNVIYNAFSSFLSLVLLLSVSPIQDQGFAVLA